MSDFEEPRVEEVTEGQAQNWDVKEALQYMGAADVRLILRNAREGSIEERLSLIAQERNRDAAYLGSLAAKNGTRTNRPWYRRVHGTPRA